MRDIGKLFIEGYNYDLELSHQLNDFVKTLSPSEINEFNLMLPIIFDIVTKTKTVY